MYNHLHAVRGWQPLRMTWVLPHLVIDARICKQRCILAVRPGFYYILCVLWYVEIKPMHAMRSQKTSGMTCSVMTDEFSLVSIDVWE